MKDKLMHFSMRTGIFLLRGAGWTSVGILIGFVTSYFYRVPGRVDTFALTETLLGVVITGLSIVGAFMIVLQWSTLESKIHGFDVKVKETSEFFNKIAGDNAKEITETLMRRKMFEMDEEKMMKNHQELFERSYKHQQEVGKMIQEYEKVIKEIGEERSEWSKKSDQMIKDYRKVIDDTTSLQDQLFKMLEDFQNDLQNMVQKPSQ